MSSYKDVLLADHCYHIYNRAIGDEKLFRIDKNYVFFFQKFCDYLLPVSEVYCYSLLPTHFHFLLRILPLTFIEKRYILIKRKQPQILDNKTVDEFLMEQFSNFFNSYTKSFNSMFQRKGKLFMDNLNRREIISETYFSKIVHYIHANPVHHHYCKKIEDWNYSSYRILIGKQETILKRNEVLDWFGGKEAFMKFHQQEIILKP